VDNTLCVEVGDVLSKVFFTLIGAKALDRCTGLIFDKGLPSFKDVKDCFG
jgi:hypothetical protein